MEPDLRFTATVESPDLPFTATVESQNGVARVALRGELDLSTVAFLSERLSAVEQNGVGAIMLDLRDLTFMDSIGLNAFLQAHKRVEATGKRFILVGASPLVRRVFEITRTEFLLAERDGLDLLEQFVANEARIGDGTTKAGVKSYD